MTQNQKSEDLFVKACADPVDMEFLFHRSHDIFMGMLYTLENIGAIPRDSETVAIRMMVNSRKQTGESNSLLTAEELNLDQYMIEKLSDMEKVGMIESGSKDGSIGQRVNFEKITVLWSQHFAKHLAEIESN